MIAENTIEEEVMNEGAHAFLAKPLCGREFKEGGSTDYLPPTREELIRDHSDGESTISLSAYALAKAWDFIGARKAIELLDDHHSQRMLYIWLLS